MWWYARRSRDSIPRREKQRGPCMSETAAPPESPRSTRATNLWLGIKRFGSALTAREDRFFLLLAVLIGVFSGLSVVCFRMAIDFFHLWLLRSAEHPPILRLLLVPCLAGIVIAIIFKRFAPDLRGSGVNQTKTAVYISDGDIPFHTVYGK